MTDESERNSSLICEADRCTLEKNKIYKKRPQFLEKVVKMWRRLSLDKRKWVGYSINNQKSLKCDDEESRQKVKSPASREGCKPGESSPLLKITSELQPES